MAENDKRGEERQPAALRIRLRYPDVETFIDKYATNVSKGGIFIATRTPKPVGATVRFEFQLADGSPVVKGEGKVIWVKEFDPQQPHRPHGMGLKFTRLDSASRGVLERLLAHKARPAEPSGTITLPREGSGPTAVREGSGATPLPVEVPLEAGAPAEAAAQPAGDSAPVASAPPAPSPLPSRSRRPRPRRPRRHASWCRRRRRPRTRRGRWRSWMPSPGRSASRMR